MPPLGAGSYSFTSKRNLSGNYLLCCFQIQTAAREEILANGGSLSHHHGGRISNISTVENNLFDKVLRRAITVCNLRALDIS